MGRSRAAGDVANGRVFLKFGQSLDLVLDDVDSQRGELVAPLAPRGIEAARDADIDNMERRELQAMSEDELDQRRVGGRKQGHAS